MCGLAGLIRKEKGFFDFSTFCTLGIANDSRGGDSCGIFIDGEVEYGTGTYNKYFQNFMFDSKLLQKTNSSKIALVHCRKASIGGISEKTAQPVVIRDKTGAVRFVLIHNGTVHNYKELAEKYIPKVDITGMTDSQVMARIFYYTGYDSLSEYQGGAVFVIVDYRQPEPTTYLWRGVSRKTAYSKEEEEERPLYLSIDDEELVFSSISSFLWAQRPYSGVFEAPGNRLLKWTGEKLESVRAYGRSEVGQWKPTVSHSPGTTYVKTYPVIYTSRYILYKSSTGLYEIDGTPATGIQYINKYGKLGDAGKDMILVYFFHGIPIKKYKHYSFLEKCLKKSGLGVEEFMKKNQNLVRYFSGDRVYPKDGVTLEATGFFDSRPYTGKHIPIGSLYWTEYRDGRYVSRGSGDYEVNLRIPEETPNKELIKKVCG